MGYRQTLLEQWLGEQMGLAALGKGLKRNLPFIAEHLPDIPELAYRALE